jgi:hypothetical protein
MIAAQIETERLCHGLARKVILGGPKPSGKDDDLSTRERHAAGLPKVLRPVAHNCLKDDIYAQLIQALRQEQGIGVLAEGRQELGADSNDLSIHV